MSDALNTSIGSIVVLILLVNIVSCDDLSGKINDNERKIDDLSDKINDMSDKIDDLQTTVDGNSGHLSNGTFYHLDGVSDKIDDIQTDVNYIRLYCK